VEGRLRAKERWLHSGKYTGECHQPIRTPKLATGRPFGLYEKHAIDARPSWMHGINFDDQSKLIKDLKNLCYNLVLRERGYLASHEKNLISISSNIIKVIGGAKYLDYIFCRT
jgi:hypothetical protein